MIRHILSVAVSALLLASSCGGDSGEQPDQQTAFFEVIHERPAPGEPADSAVVAALVEANTETAFRLYREMRGEEPNLIFSPYSISRVLSNYYSPGYQDAAFAAVLGFTAEIGGAPGWATLKLSAVRDADDGSSFNVSDIYWVDDEASGEADHANFDRVHRMDLQAPDARDLINDWVEQKSGGMLKDHLTSPLGDAKAIATNLVYFQGAWLAKFEAGSVDFNGSPVPAFTGKVATRAAATDGITVVQIPYESGYSHWILMPDTDFDGFASSLDAEQFDALRSGTSEYDVTLTAPEFSTKSEPDLGGAITEIRERTGTDGGTLTGAHMEGFLHQAAIEVTKDGTRAAAVTSVLEFDNNAPEPPPQLTVTIDKAFVHAIVHNKSGSILFLGEQTE